MGSIDNLVSTLQVQKVGKGDSLATTVAKQLEAEITSGRIQVGHKLPTESALCDLFGVSRTVIREAITQLKSLGLVETRRGVGTTVMRAMSSETVFAYNVDPTAIKDILHILEIRMSVESAACALAAERRSEADLAKMEQLFEDFDGALVRGELARKEDYQFHLAICQATHNPFFKQFYEQFNKNVIPRAKLVNANVDPAASEEYLQRVRNEHEAILTCIRNKDAEGAKEAMYQHLNRAYLRYERYNESNTFD
ncbi:FadR family transcriptional regulator [Maribrevibacterium harenarium]|uniref:FadR family transcriptional regulator n=1 Tax=Maribrevibacterium harenarium TaxID=2589817 RepID=A0A501WT86_9GAMM|nr:FadR/GntR family transcriptional regulator [Maribrevibacterium harenarium]TPE49016.1 FadR family transcriptional regulator [Maribrevibacterium harenarium]